jgi:hypothetical protein
MYLLKIKEKKVVHIIIIIMYSTCEIFSGLVSKLSPQTTGKYLPIYSTYILCDSSYL